MTRAALLELAVMLAMEAGWPTSLINAIPSLRPEVAETVCIATARDLIERNRSATALEALRIFFADARIVIVNATDSGLLALAIWEYDLMGDTSPFNEIRLAFLREWRKRQCDGLLQPWARARIPESIAAEEVNEQIITEEQILTELLARIPDARTRRELQWRMSGRWLRPADWHHLQRRYRQISELIRQISGQVAR